MLRSSYRISLGCWQTCSTWSAICAKGPVSLFLLFSSQRNLCILRDQKQQPWKKKWGSDEQKSWKHSIIIIILIATICVENSINARVVYEWPYILHTHVASYTHIDIYWMIVHAIHNAYWMLMLECPHVRSLAMSRSNIKMVKVSNVLHRIQIVL